MPETFPRSKKPSDTHHRNIPPKHTPKHTPETYPLLKLPGLATPKIQTHMDVFQMCISQFETRVKCFKSAVPLSCTDGSLPWNRE